MAEFRPRNESDLGVANTAPFVVSFYTPEYAHEYRPFAKSAKDFGYEVYTEQRNTQGTWRLNCGMKPRFLLEMFQKFSRPLLWLDIDARFRAPWDIAAIENRCDFACWFIPHPRMRPIDIPGGRDKKRDGLASGTMFFNYTGPAVHLLDSWIETDHGQHKYEQMVLGEAWYDHRPEDLDTERLPQRYCKVFDSPWFGTEGGPIVIEHTQASRRLRRLVDKHR